MVERCNVAVLGASGAVGREILSILHSRQFPLDHIHALGSERSAGTTLVFGDRQIEVRNVADFSFADTQIALFSAGASVSAEYAPRAAAQACVVIDNTSHFRLQADIPLIVPEVNAECIATCRRGIIANPNCSTIQMAVALAPIYREVGIHRINVATYQAVSGSGRRGIRALQEQTAQTGGRDGVAGEIGTGPYPLPIAFNVLPHIDDFVENGYTREEMKMVRETQKIFSDPEIQINPTCVRVPVYRGHSEALHIETRKKISCERARALLEEAPGVVLMDGRRAAAYPTPAREGDGEDAVYVGRLREDISHPNGLAMWIVSDNLRKGAALNSVQIAETLLRDDLLKKVCKTG